MAWARVSGVRAPLPPLPGLQAFEAAARTGSLAAAAEELHLSPAAVSQRVRSLETSLGIALFDRGARSVTLTEMGQAYLPSVRAAFDELAVSTSGLFAPARRDQLTVRAPISYVTTWLAPRLQDFGDLHPHIDLRVITAIWADIHVVGDVDIDIRQGTGIWADSHAELLHTDAAALVHGPEHERRHGPIRSITDLAERPRVQVLGFDDLWQQLWNTHDLVATGRTITVDTATSAVELAAHGEPVALLPERFARPALRTGQVRAAMPHTIPMRHGHYLVRPDNDPTPGPQAQVFLRWLREQDATDPPEIPPTP